MGATRFIFLIFLLNEKYFQSYFKLDPDDLNDRFSSLKFIQ